MTDFPNEVELTIKETGNRIAFPSAEVEPAGTSYVRVLNPDGEEIAYWIFEEWAEEPETVMGAILGALCRSY